MTFMEALTIKPIIEQHAEEAAFLWPQRDAAIHEPHYSLKDIAHLDDRLEAHIDGLRIAGETGWEICKQALALNEPGEVFVAALLAFEGDDGQRVDEVLKVAIEAPENWRALISALGWLSDEDYQRWVPGLLTANDLSYRRLAIAASVIHRQNSTTALAAALDDPEPNFQARALRAVGELKRRDLLPALQQKFKSDDPACQFWATWSAVLLGDKTALDVLKTFATADSAFLEQALQIMLRVMDVPNSTKWLSDFTQSPEVLRHAVLGAGIIGDPMYIPWLINLMTVPEVSRVAGEAFSMITGVDLAYDDLEGEWPEGFEAGPTENPADEDVAMDADEDLPWPEPELINAWWDKNKNQFRFGTRYLVGKPISVEHCQQVLNTGFQRQRRAAALELALLQKDLPLFNTSAPGFRQQQLLRQPV
jgi:uncharacterized protein (TIGR02270 family)